ncbi:DNA repair protein RecO [Candidatus Parcubacteria bacterium]|jgi:DNA repair protein RecO (recombination protein O)|nr:MAG: DNA repair protein RecO [Candidatus Parcubacteria bacterium]
MSLHEVTGVILNRRDVREDSRIYSVFTHERGKLEVFARGIKKPKAKLGGHMEPGATVKLTLVRGKMGETLTAVERRHYPNDIMQSLEKLASLGFVLNLIDSATKTEAPDPMLASFLQEVIDRLEILQARKTNLARFRLWFAWRIFRLLGLGPELDTCVHCRKALTESGVRFSAILGGWLGLECQAFDAQAPIVNTQARSFIHALNRLTWEELESFEIDVATETVVARITQAQLHQILERPLPAEKFVNFIRTA